MDQSNETERERVRALAALHLMDSAPEERFDRITRLARELFDVQGAAVTLLDENRLFSLSPQVPGHTVVDRNDSFCDVTIRQQALLVVPDATQDDRFSWKPEVTGGFGIRFYAGRPLSVGDGHRVGSLCLFDTKPRDLSPGERELLEEMAQWAEREVQDSAEQDHAALVQQGLLPTSRPGSPEYEIAGICLPKRGVGGDYYSWTTTGSGNIEFTLADIMGKGAGAAIIAATVRQAFNAASGNKPARALDEATRALQKDLSATGFFATVLHATLNPGTGDLEYVDAGHGLTLIIRADGTEQRLATSGLPLGIAAPGSWEQQHSLLHPGDTLISVTDGVLDLYDGTLAALPEIASLVRAAGTPEKVMAEVARLVGSGNAQDDVTAIAIQRTSSERDNSGDGHQQEMAGRPRSHSMASDLAKKNP
ncbi:PP2C family protein-serine/threonine phosphatase [Arthrobacter rhizosphaerae]|uniref:PP2C family protein-serine/threonine phosphatase n=1 Tax=Arthrobacter rhizosphaerae TaxID=2855490 RepID=UPI001FF566C8|nr:SpoIIE family protein phosphatase [Arthrobacter rhizosphaerae]